MITVYAFDGEVLCCCLDVGLPLLFAFVLVVAVDIASHVFLCLMWLLWGMAILLQVCLVLLWLSDLWPSQARY